MVHEASRIVDELTATGIIIRVLGATAIRMHAHQHAELHIALGRELSDLDFAAYGKQRERVEEYFTKKLGYQIYSPAASIGLLMDRCIFFDKAGVMPRVDVFLDKLQMNHVIDFSNRLETYYPTVPVTELLLEKLQIVKINEKDIKDLIILLLAHQLDETGTDVIDENYIAKLLSRDWGFYYSVTSNLHKLESMIKQYAILGDEARREVVSKIGRLTRRLEREPKSARWRMRARVGASMTWYNEVEEVERADWTKGITIKD